MPTPQERVASAMRFFFERALPPATGGKTFAQLSDPKVHLGAYVRHAGGPVPTSLGQTVTPQFALRVSPDLPVAGGQPNPAGATVAPTGPVRHILWVRHAADAAVDDEAEIQRVMADMDSFVQSFREEPGPGAAAAGAAETDGGAAAGSGAPPAGGAPGGATPPAGGVTPPAGGGGSGAGATAATARAAARAADWARAIVASRAALGVNLSALTEVPAGLREVAGDLPGLKQVLQHFFTYTADGTYYRRWAGAGRDAGNAAHLTPEYKRENVREVQLERERTYLYMVVPESLLAGGGDLGQGVFREVVVRFDESGEEERPFTLSTLHTARWRRPSAPHEDFVFFHAEEGLGLPVTREVGEKIAPRLQSLLAEYFAATAAPSGAEPQPAGFQPAGAGASTGAAAFVHLMALVEGTPAFPAGVIASGEGPMRTLLVPPERVTEVAALPAVKQLTTVPKVYPALDQARAMVQQAALASRIPAASRGGKGVLVGIIDSGIDGGHPAFAGRLVAYWDQGNIPLTAGQTPKARHAGNAAYTALDWGVELMGTTETANAKDDDGHGTHVAGIAAGAEVRTGTTLVCPGGLAPQAQIVGVRCIGVDGGDPTLALDYVFQKAKELSLPCVVNMSYGHSGHSHDGSDDLSFYYFGMVHPTSTNAYRPGRILVGAAGNDRRFHTHVRRALPAAGPPFNFGLATFAILLGSRLPATATPPALPYKEEVVTIWVRNPLTTHPLIFPLDLWVWRRANPLAGTALVRLGSSDTQTFPGLQLRVRVTSQVWNPLNGDFHYEVRFRYLAAGNGNLPHDTWVMALLNRSPHPLDVHAWIVAGAHGGSEFEGPRQADDRAYMVGSPADSPALVSVASADSRLTWRPAGAAADLAVAGTLREISAFSSPGPLRASSRTINQIFNTTEDIRAIDVTAPGRRLQSAASALASANGMYDPDDIVTKDAAGVARSAMMQGTSMACPVVTGLVANLLAVKPNLTTLDVIDRLKRASSVPATSALQPPPPPAGQRPWSRDWGFGLVDGTTLDIT